MAEATPELDLDREDPGTVEVVRRRTRPRQRRIHKKTRNKIAHRVVDFWDEDEQDHADDLNRRLERYAKIRGWAEEDTDFPWPDSSNVAYPDISRSCEDTQDSLVNAALATRPTVLALAQNPDARDRERKLSRLLDTQFYEEQTGEVNMHELSQTFTEDGSFVAYVPWVREHRNVLDRVTYDPIPENESPLTYLRDLAMQRFPRPKWQLFRRESNGWAWKAVSADGKQIREIDFWTKDEIEDDSTGAAEDIEMEVQYVGLIYDGPKVIVKDYEDVMAPSRSANLQIPGPSNPNGATHVILRDYPTVDEIMRLQKDGVYDLVKAKELEGLSKHGEDTSHDPAKEQKDVLQGEQERTSPDDFTHRVFTRYTCFDIYDFEDGQGPVDMVWTVLREPRMLLRAKRLTELHPVPDGERPMRPLAEASYLPVKGRRQGRGLPELMEGLHDLVKSLFDQIKDAGDMAITPFGFYDPSGDLNAEITGIAPGELYPISNPNQSILFPQLNTNGMAFGINLITMASQLQEKLTVMGDLQQGRVPAGRSSAFRTSGNLQALLAQGEARPERVLRRFFMGVTQIYRLMHRLNQFYLPKEKQFRVVGFLAPDEDPYQAVTRADVRAGRFDFVFQPNVQNASLAAKQEALVNAMGILVDPVSVQLGLVTPDDVYRIKRDLARTFVGDQVDNYISAPGPQSTRRKITAAGALNSILHNEVPNGRPLEPAQEHLQTIEKLLQMQQRGQDGKTVQLRNMLTKVQEAILSEYLRDVGEIVSQEQQQAAAAQAAQQAQQQRQSQQIGPGRPAENVGADTSAPQVGSGELIDESLPTAGGGTVQ